MGNYSAWFQGLATCVGVLGLTILYGVLVAIGPSVAELLVRVARPGMNGLSARRGFSVLGPGMSALRWTCRAPR